MFQGLRTVIYTTDDLSAAKEWYTKVLGFPPYFDEPFYVGFNVGGYELALDPHAVPVREGSTLVYWGVDDIDAAFEQLLTHGAQERTSPEHVGGEIWVATVQDPFGNVLGIIENPDFTLS